MIFDLNFDFDFVTLFSYRSVEIAEASNNLSGSRRGILGNTYLYDSTVDYCNRNTKYVLTIQSSTVLYCTVLLTGKKCTYSTVQYSTVQYSK